MASVDASSNSSSIKQYKIPMLATPTQQLSSFPAGPFQRKKTTSDHKRKDFGRDTQLVAYISSRPESRRQDRSRVIKDLPPSLQVPLQHVASPIHERGTCGMPFLSTTKTKSVPLPIVYIKHQYNINKGIRNVSLHSKRFAPVPARTRLKSDSLLDLPHQTKSNKLYEHLVAGKHDLEQSRLLKLQSEIIPHRLNHRYYMSGKEMSLKDRYDVPEEELLRLKKLSLSANAELYYGKGMNQRKAVQSKHKQMLEETLDRYKDKLADVDKGGDKVGGDSSSESEAESHESGNDVNETVMAVSEPVEKKVAIILMSDAPSTTFLTDIKVTDPNMLDDIIDEELIDIYRKKFEELDIDGSGSITLDELRASLFGTASDADIQFIMSLFDLDNSNSIELDEFIAVASLNDKILGKKRTADEPLQLDLSQLNQYLRQYKELFGLFDDDGNGEISVEELMILLSASMGIDEGSNPDFMRSIMRKVDKDENGTIDFHEFLRFIPFFLGIHDKILTEPLSIRQMHSAKVKVRQHLRK